MEITKRVEITIADKELVRLVVDALYPRGFASTSGSERTLCRVLYFLPGRTAVEAVKEANRVARAYPPYEPTITTREFRWWLPQVLSKALMEVEVSGNNQEGDGNNSRRGVGWARS